MGKKMSLIEYVSLFNSCNPYQVFEMRRRYRFWTNISWNEKKKFSLKYAVRLLGLGTVMFNHLKSWKRHEKTQILDECYQLGRRSALFDILYFSTKYAKVKFFLILLPNGNGKENAAGDVSELKQNLIIRISYSN